jgi:hypothetical protein
MHVQTDDIHALSSNSGIITGQIALEAMGFQASFFLDAMHGVFAHSQRRRQFAATRVHGTIAGLPAGDGQNPGPQGGSQNRGLLAGMIGLDCRKRPFQRIMVGALVCADV